MFYILFCIQYANDNAGYYTVPVLLIYVHYNKNKFFDMRMLFIYLYVFVVNNTLEMCDLLY